MDYSLDSRICWEYKQISLSGIVDNVVELELNEMGENGWELVSATLFNHAYKAILKRRVW